MLPGTCSESAENVLYRRTSTTTPEQVEENIPSSGKIPHENRCDPNRTVRSNIQNLVKKARLAPVQDRLVPITIWDFGGQEIFYVTHQTFLSSRCIYMLVFNLFEMEHLTQNRCLDDKGKYFISSI